jgi:uncharacterized protein YbbC (DUF1343 family)
MKFDAARASAIFEKLDDPAFSGPEGQRRIADFVADEFRRMGWNVTRREVEGSRFPQRVGPWIMWIGYGAFITIGFCVILVRNPIVQILAILTTFFVGVKWVDALAFNWIRPGRWMRPLEKAPVVIASVAGDSSPPVRVVFQTVLGRIDTGFLGLFRIRRYFILIILHLCFWTSALFTFFGMWGGSRLLWVTIIATWLSIAFAWVIILCVLSWEYRHSRSADAVLRTDRLSTALLLELARSWPIRRSAEIEPTFIVAGGQRLDYAGSRAVVRMIESEWPRKPSILLLLFAPGAEGTTHGSESVLRIAALRGSGGDLAKNAANSLWIPHRDESASLPSLWPFDSTRVDEPIALLGSDLVNEPGAAVPPETLNRAAQLAMEITLRWTKLQKVITNMILWLAVLAGSAAAHETSAPGVEPVQCGIDVLVADGFRPMHGLRVGLVTNHTGVTRDGKTTIDVLFHAPNVKLVRLFSPEHGIRGEVDKEVPDGQDRATGLPIVSLYGKQRKPRREDLVGVDALVYDIQDVGTRFYTYISTLGLVLEAAAESKKQLFVLDRPNPIGGQVVSGPVRDAEFASFIAYHALPVRHGMTVGELALLYNAERKLGASLEVIRCRGWSRDDLYDRTGLVWINPSPNMRSLTEALLYPGVGLLEATNLATGRGTDAPFERVGAPWIDPRAFAAAVSRAAIPGVRFVPIYFTPGERQYAGERCGGVHISVTNWDAFDPLKVGTLLALELRRLYPEKWEPMGLMRMLADRPTYEAILAGRPLAEIMSRWDAEIADFHKVRSRYLLY